MNTAFPQLILSTVHMINVKVVVNMGREYGREGYYGGSSFALIVVLFILLIIIGASYLYY